MAPDRLVAALALSFAEANADDTRFAPFEEFEGGEGFRYAEPHHYHGKNPWFIVGRNATHDFFLTAVLRWDGREYIVLRSVWAEDGPASPGHHSVVAGDDLSGGRIYFGHH